jgi:uncharacterized membrane protein YedE/YeeE
LAVSILYPFFYESYQVSLSGWSYFIDIWNYSDISYNLMSVANLYFQIVLGPYNTVCRLIMCLIILMIIIKSFFFLRIFPSLAPIVVMINSVIYDLRIFMGFYFVLICFFSMVFMVLGLGNERLHEEGVTRLLKASAGGAVSTVT